MRITLLRHGHTAIVEQDGNETITVVPNGTCTINVNGKVYKPGDRQPMHDGYGMPNGAVIDADGIAYDMRGLRADARGRISTDIDWKADAIENRILMEELFEAVDQLQADMRLALAPDKYDTLGVMSPSDKTDF